MSAPETIADILSGPHLRTVVRDSGTSILMVEPLRVMPVIPTLTARIRCDVCGHYRSTCCAYSRCGLAEDC